MQKGVRLPITLKIIAKELEVRLSFRRGAVRFRELADRHGRQRRAPVLRFVSLPGRAAESRRSEAVAKPAPAGASPSFLMARSSSLPTARTKYNELMPTFASLFGQESAVAALRRALAPGTIPGTYLFIGAAGTGKGALARAAAQAAACLTPQQDPFDSCGNCDSCRRADAGSHPEICLIQPAGEQTQIFQFWERDNRSDSGLLSRTLNYAPLIGRRRVYIIERAETLTESAANSLLKVLEEPPPYALFILLAPNAARLLPTIVSRSQMLRVVPEARDALACYLEERHNVSPEQAELYAALAEGKTGQAVRLAQAPKVGAETANILEFASTIPDAPPLRALKLAEQMRKLATQVKALVGDDSGADTPGGDDDGSPKDRGSRRQLAAVFDLLTVYYRDLLALSAGGAAADTIMDRRNRDKLALQAQGDTPRWAHCLDSITIARRRLDANASIPMVTDVLVLELVS
jgi:DNA polymerase-3 subunit delta'